MHPLVDQAIVVRFEIFFEVIHGIEGLQLRASGDCFASLGKRPAASSRLMTVAVESRAKKDPRDAGVFISHQIK
jgi:hypothetical protein